MAWKHVTSPPPRKLHVFALACKVMSTVFWDSEGIVLIDYLQCGRTITETYYADLMGKCPAAWENHWTRCISVERNDVEK